MVWMQNKEPVIKRKQQKATMFSPCIIQYLNPSSAGRVIIQQRWAGSVVKRDLRGMYAVLVDCDNISSKKIDLVFNEIKSCGGHAVIRLLFGDFNSGSLKPWDKKAKEWSFDKVKTPLIITGKSSVDATLIKKGLEIVHQVDGFAIVSSDSDFMPLALNLQKSGKHVIGFGMKKTLLKYRNAYDHFVYLDSTACDSSPDSTAYAKLQSIVKNLKSENGWTDISSVGQQLQKSDRKALGISRKKLTKFFIASTQHFEFSRHCQAGVVRCARHGRSGK